MSAAIQIFSPEEEAVYFGSYLLKRKPDAFSIELYASAINKSTYSITGTDKKIFSFLYRHPWTLGLIDSGMALIMRESEVRRRIFVLYSILECSTEYVDHFFPKRRSRWFLLLFIYSGTRGCIKGLLGSILLKIIT